MRIKAGCTTASIALFSASVLAAGCGSSASSGGASSGPPTSVAIFLGDNQSAVVSTPLASSPVVLVSDDAGRTVAGVPVSFSIVDGGGSITPASATTDGSGLAATEWTLGPTVGLNHLRAYVAGVPTTVTFTATGTAPVGVPSSIAITAGDNQTAAPGAAVALTPVVVVKDAYGSAVAGANVVFAVSGGGGTIQTPTARTDASGLASCGTWTLGSAVGVNTVSAMVTGVSPVTFVAVGARTSTDVKVSVPSPTPGQTVGESVAVVATVTSAYQIAAVTASAGGATIPLTLGTYKCGMSVWCPGWLGTISVAGRPRGLVSVVVTARDVLGNTTNVVVSVLFDTPPTVLVSAPLDGTVARPATNIVATCSDDNPAGCKSLTATVGGKVVASGKGTISQSIDLSASEGLSVNVVFTGEDSIGQQVTVTRNVFVESSTHLAVKAEVSGTVWDASGTRVLYLDTSGTTPALKETDTANGTTQVLETGPNLVGTWGCYGFLTSAGAIYAHGEVGSKVYPYCWAYEWRAGAITQLGGLDSCQSLVATPTSAIYSSGSNLWRRDLVAGTSTLIATNAGNSNNDVASSQDIAYWGNSSGSVAYNIYQWRGGSSLALTNDASASLSNVYPVTDGVNVVYQKRVAQTYRIAMHNGSGETILTPASTVEPISGTGYAVAGGYVAYASEDIAKTLQVWRRSPLGEQQLTIFGTSSAISAIAPDGVVLLTHTGRRFRAAPGIALQDIGSSLGRVVVRDGRFLVLLGRAVLEVVP